MNDVEFDEGRTTLLNILIRPVPQLATQLLLKREYGTLQARQTVAEIQFKQLEEQLPHVFPDKYILVPHILTHMDPLEVEVI
jgi:hypothetical protein